MMKFKLDSHYRDCPVCGRSFFVPDFGSYVYRRGTLFFCKWSCMRSWDKKRDKEEKKRCGQCAHCIGKLGHEVCIIKEREHIKSSDTVCEKYIWKDYDY